MLSIMLKSKIHNATITDANLKYKGSLSIDSKLMEAVNIRPYEKILVANLENGKRFETYAIPAEPESGSICLNGATVHLGAIGDRVIIFAFGIVSDEEATSHKPDIINLDKSNKPLS